MANQYHRLLDAQILPPNWVQPKEDVFDAGAWKEVEAHYRGIKTGSAGTVKLQTAAVNEPDAWVDVTGLSWSLSGTGGLASSSHYLRYLRAVTDGAVAGAPAGLIDLVLKN